MFCPKCGKELNEECAFCPTCGSSLKEDTAKTPIKIVSNSGFYDKPKEMFRSTSDASVFGFLQKFRSISAFVFCIGLLLIFVALLPVEAYEDIIPADIFDNVLDVSPTVFKLSIGTVGFIFGIPIILLSIKMLKSAGTSRKLCMSVLEKNHIIVYEKSVEGCTCGLNLSNIPEFETFSIPLNDIVRVQVERERCDFKIDNPIIDVLSIYTEQKKYQIWAISDVQVLANNINNLLKK